MIVEGSKDYSSGEILMICSDNATSDYDAWEYLKTNYGVTPQEGTLEYTSGSDFCGYWNPPTYLYKP